MQTAPQRLAGPAKVYGPAGRPGAGATHCGARLPLRPVEYELRRVKSVREQIFVIVFGRGLACRLALAHDMGRHSWLVFGCGLHGDEHLPSLGDRC